MVVAIVSEYIAVCERETDRLRSYDNRRLGQLFNALEKLEAKEGRKRASCSPLIV